MAIPDGFKDEIKARIRLSELIGRTVALKRQGREFVGLSPFRKERTPSFTVNDEKGFYHCFSSQESGDAFTWLQKTQGLSFMEALEALGREAGLEVPRAEQFNPEREQRRKSLLDWIACAQDYFTEHLFGSSGQEARAYLERRGLSTADMKQFGLGFAPEARRGLTRALTAKGAKPDELVDTGLLIIPDDGGEPYDRFRGRVMFPIKDPRDRLVAFGGRAMNKDVRAKYVNSPATGLFQKGSLLYRYREARMFANEPKVRAKGLIVAEGYMDVIAFVRAGLGHAVAPLGTALTENQLRLLWRAGPEPIVCLDGDAAGRRAAALAAERALELLEPGRTLQFVFLPDGQDPDDLLREKGADALKSAMTNLEPLVEVLWRREVDVEPLDGPDSRASFRKRLRDLAAKIRNPGAREEYRNEFDKRFETLFGYVLRPRGRKKGESVGPPTKETVESRKKERTPPDGRKLLLACIEFPEIAESGADTLSEMPFRTLDNLRDAIIDACSPGGRLSADDLRQFLVRRGYDSQLKSLNTDRQAMRADLGGEKSTAESRLEAWNQLSASYMERFGQDSRDQSEERTRMADFIEKGDSKALNRQIDALRQSQKR